MMTYNDWIKALYYWQYDPTDSFYERLFELYQKADPENKGRLIKGFPDLGKVMDEWEFAGDYGNNLFRSHGLME